MRCRVHSTTVVATLLLASLPATAVGETSDVGASLVRSALVEISDEEVRSWASAECGAEISLPWFDGDEMAATVARVDVDDDHVMVTGAVEADALGRFLLTINDSLVGAITIDGAVYRLRSRDGGEYSLVEYDPNVLMPDNRDTDDGRRSPGRVSFHPQAFQSRMLANIPLKRLTALLNLQRERGPTRALRDSGETIDVLMAVTKEAADWAKSEGLNLSSEIMTMVGEANGALAASAIVPRLRVVGVAFVEYSVEQPEKLETDANNLRNGSGALGVLHDLRDALKADLVSLLVFNGRDCAGVESVACGYGFTQRDIAGPNDTPGTPAWEDTFASLGFSVVSIFSAVNGFSFTHEVGHNLGAHHDWYSFSKDGYAATVDPFARGWIMRPVRARTVMAYDTLCEDEDLGSCEILHVFSNPLQSYFGERRGDPAPGFPPTALGPADNKTAINNMALTVANYRVSLP